MDYTIRIGGEAGQGIQTIGGTLARFFSRAGYHVFSHQDYESRVRGGHNFYQVRVSDRAITASRDAIDILVALDRDSILLHEKELSSNGQVLYDSSELKQRHEKPHFLDIPFVTLAIEHGKNKIMANAVAMGSILGLLEAEPDILFEIIKNTFSRKGDEVVNSNINAAKAGYDFAATHCKECRFSLDGRSDQRFMLINGVEAVALSAISSGCKFYSAYPMTPSTGIMNYIAGKEKEYGIVVEQAEDEISAINMALGASFAGVRAMTGTSGGGFALMVEGLSLSAVTETPIVIALAQRPGPATGLPTRTEQADLQFALYSAHGEFPRVIFAPGTPEQAFYLTNRAFDIAERYQVPVIIMTDQYLGDSQWTYERFDTERIKYNDYRLRGDTFKNLPEYKRHAFTETGVSPLGVPGDSRHLVVTDSDEHNEEGHLIEDADTRVKMVNKRLFEKMRHIRDEINPPLLYGESEPEIVLVCWGSSYGVVKEAVDVLSDNSKIAMLHFSELYPFPLSGKFDYTGLMERAKLSVCIEGNATGQFARLIRAETGFKIGAMISKYDGRPFTVESLLKELYEHIKGL